MEEVLVRLHRSELEEEEAEPSSSEDEADPLEFLTAETLARLQQKQVIFSEMSQDTNRPAR